MTRHWAVFCLFLAAVVTLADAFSRPIPSSASSSRYSTTIHQVSTTTASATTSIINTTPAYPTARGTTTDSRQIIATGAGRQYLTAVRLAHVRLATEELATQALHQLRDGSVRLADLAQQISACPATRDAGGEIGWVSVEKNEHEDEHDGPSSGGTKPSSDPATTNHRNNTPSTSRTIDQSHLDDILPPEARRQVVHITTKPGDVVLVESTLGFHLVQILDVMADVRQMATAVRPRKHPSHLPQFDTLTYKMETMGCQMNMADSERMEGQLQSLGMRPHSDNDSNQQQRPPDVVVLNTCSIRDHAEQKVYSYIGPHAKRKRAGEDVTIIVAGCVAQQEGAALLRRAPEVDLVMGPQYANRLADLLEDVSLGNQVVATEATHIMEDSTKPRRQSTVAAWVNVIYGCNERCSFCIVPTTRGVEQSRPVESIVDEVHDLVAKGYKEVTLLGQNIDAYGRDMIPKRKFSDLLRTVGSVPGLERLRFVTSHPRYMSLGVVDAVAETPTACESFHIPFQSGSNEVLAAMGRGHTREKYLHIVDRIRSRIPDASITADVIVGFPGETEEQFQETLSLMETVVFDSVNTAAYSPRPNTPAATYDNQIDDAVKQDRLQRINALNKQHATQRRARMLGRTVEVLVEERNVKVPTQVMGRTRHGYIVYLEGDIDELRGETVSVEIEACHAYYLAGKRVL